MLGVRGVCACACLRRQATPRRPRVRSGGVRGLVGQPFCWFALRRSSNLAAQAPPLSRLPPPLRGWVVRVGWAVRLRAFECVRARMGGKS
jgi:hypothetical protein